MVAVFQWGWLASLFGVDQTGPIMSLHADLLIGIVFGLAMDYQVFLVTRMREEYVHGAGAAEAIVTGFRHSARVVTAAAIIMIAVFGGFILGQRVVIKPIGFALAVGVLFDAFVVRMTIVPAVDGPARPVRLVAAALAGPAAAQRGRGGREADPDAGGRRGG